MDGLLDIAGSVIQGLGDAYVQEQERQSRQEEEETLNILKVYKEFIRAIKSDFPILEDYDEIETGEEVQSAFIQAIMVACVYSCDNVWYKELTGEDSEDEDDVDFLAQINEVLNEFLEDTDLERDFLSRGMEKYYHKMHVIYEELDDAESGDDIDIEDLYYRMQRAVSDFKNVLTNANRLINSVIDEYYEEY